MTLHSELNTPILYHIYLIKSIVFTLMFNDINREKPMIMFIDLNSAFATAEQQAHPTLRGKPMGVTNRISKECCVIAASYEAKALGIKVGMRLSDAKAICKDFIMLETDAPKYHQVYQKLVRIMKDYSPKTWMKSIDEGVIDFHGMEPTLNGRTLVDIGYEIKQRVRDEIGDWMKINVGIGTNVFLAKQAAGWHKPDGLDVIDHKNLKKFYAEHTLLDLTGIAERNEARLNAYGIMNPLQFLAADEYMLKKRVFNSITGTYWYRRLRGYEIDDFDTKLGMIGRQWVLRDPTNKDDLLRSYLSFLCETTGMKVRYKNVEARGVCVWARFRMVNRGTRSACTSLVSIPTKKYTDGRLSSLTSGRVVLTFRQWEYIATGLNLLRQVR